MSEDMIDCMIGGLIFAVMLVVVVLWSYRVGYRDGGLGTLDRLQKKLGIGDVDS